MHEKFKKKALKAPHNTKKLDRKHDLCTKYVVRGEGGIESRLSSLSNQ